MTEDTADSALRGPHAGSASDAVLSGRSRHAATTFGVAAVWAASQLALVGLGAGAALRLLPTSLPTLWYAAALFGIPGWILISGGQLRPAAVVRTLRHRSPSGAVGVGLGVVLLLALAAGAPQLPGSALLVIGLAQAPLVLAWWSWSGDAPAPVVTHRTVVSSVLAGVIVGHVALVPVLLPDAYPFAVYTMYNEPRVDPYEVPRVVFVADDGSEDERTVSVPVSRLALVQLAEDGATEDLRALAEAAADRHGADEVTVYLELLHIPPPPAAPSIEVSARTELASTGG